MKRQIVTTMTWDFTSYGGLVTDLPPPEKLEKVPFIWRSLVPEPVPKPVKLMSLSISSELWKTKWRQVGSLQMTFDRVVFNDENHVYTKAAFAMLNIMRNLWLAGTIESAHGWGPDHCGGRFHLAVDNKAFCEEALMRGATILRAFCPNMHTSSLVPKITQETYHWIPRGEGSTHGRWKTFAEIIAEKCGLVTS